MFNPFVMKKYAALLSSAMLTTILFYVGVTYYGLLGGLGFMFIGMLLSALLGSVMLKNPFSEMLEGKGILAVNLDSTGVLRFFVTKLQAPYVVGDLNGNEVDDVFDRAAVVNIAHPVKAGRSGEIVDEHGQTKGFKIELTDEEYNKGRFALFQYPVIIWNEQIKSIITKDMLGDTEKDIMSEHSILYLNQKMKELTSAVRDFGRHVVENLKPKDRLLGNKWVIIIAVILIGILLLVMAPKIITTLQGAAGPVSQAMGNVGSATGSVMPR
jgi:hypothetical protein